MSAPFYTVSTIALCVLALWTASAVASEVVSPSDPQCASPSVCSNCICRGNNITVTLRLQDHLSFPFKDATVNVTGSFYFLVNFLEQAANLDSRFLFETRYYQQMGYFITRLSGVSNIPGVTNWLLSSVTQQKNLLCGISTYVPNANEEILFKYELLIPSNRN